MPLVKNKRVNAILMECNVQNPCWAFLQALHEDSNRELDWLWCADRVNSTAERCYCLQRALYINPKNNDTVELLRATQHLHLTKKSAKATQHPTGTHGWQTRLFGV